MSFDVNILLAVTGVILLIAGLAGTIIPIIPGVPLAWLALLAGHFCSYTLTPVWILILTGIVAVIVTVADTLLQPWLTKKAGGSKAAVWGATIGLIIALFTGPAFIIIGPFIGAFIGELIQNPDDTGKALKAAAGSFLGFILGTGIKIICVIVFIWILLFEFLK